MDLADHFRIIAHNWWRIVLVSLLIAGAVYGFSSLRTEEFSASTLLNVTAGRTDQSATAAKDATVFLAATYAELATSKPVAARAARSLQISTRTAQHRVSASAASDLGFLTITARGP